MMRKLLATLGLLVAFALPASAQFSSGGATDQPALGTAANPIANFGTGPTPSATANTQGAAINITTATTGVTNSILIQGGQNDDDTVGEGTLFRISSSPTNSGGACVSPTTLIDGIVVGYSAQFAPGGVNVLLPLTIPSGTCLQVSVQSSIASSAMFPVINVSLFPGGFGATAIDNLSASTATSLGTAVTPTTTGTFGSTYTTLTASTSHAYKGFWYSIDSQSTSSGDYTFCAAQLATGASSSEVPFGPIYFFNNQSGVFTGYQNTPYLPYNVATATRLSIRMTCNGTQTAMGISLHGVR